MPFIGTTSNLRLRIYSDLVNSPGCLVNSALRRHIAISLGLGSKAELRKSSRLFSDEQKKAIYFTLLSGSFGWMVVEDESQSAGIIQKLQKLFNVGARVS